MALSMEQVMDFQTNGFVVVEDVFTDEDLQPIMNELSEIVDERGKQLYAEGKLKNLYEEEPFERRYALLHKQSAEMGQFFDIMFLRGREMFHFLKNDRLLDVAQCLLGRELTCNPIQHIRAKLPAIPGRENAFENVPWHQDAAVTSEDSEASEIITFWIPLVDATAETGCMEVMPGVFKQGYLKHQAEGGTTIMPELLPDVKPVLAECRKGGIVIMNKYTPHRGTPNRSNHIRWSIDLRYQKTGAPTGRANHPSFIVRSEANPLSVLDSHAGWSQLWEKALNQEGPGIYHRV